MPKRLREVAGLPHTYDFQNLPTGEVYSMYQSDKAELILSKHVLARVQGRGTYVSKMLNDVVLAQEMGDNPENLGLEPVDVGVENVGNFFLDSQANEQMGLWQSDDIIRMLYNFFRHSPRSASPFLGFATQHRLRESGLIVIDNADEAALRNMALSAQAPQVLNTRRQVAPTKQPAQRKWIETV